MRRATENLWIELGLPGEGLGLLLEYSRGNASPLR
jgi:hypothetical protein